VTLTEAAGMIIGLLAMGMVLGFVGIVLILR
jgi:hypothetical protein